MGKPNPSCAFSTLPVCLDGPVQRGAAAIGIPANPASTAHLLRTPGHRENGLRRTAVTCKDRDP